MKQIEQMTQNNNEESGETEENKEEEPDADEEEKEDSNDARKEMNNDMKINENENFIYSQKFKTETYEPGEEKNDYLDDNEDYNEKNNNDDDAGPKDNRKKGSFSQRGNNNMNNNNNNNYIFNMLKHSPKDNRGSFKVSKNMESVGGIGPKDSRRKDVINNKFNSFYPKMNLSIKNQIKPYNNHKSKEQFNNAANQKSHQQQNNFIKREVLSSHSSQRSFKNKKGKLSPLFNKNQNEQNYQ
jgi:hypothetical protein